MKLPLLALLGTVAVLALSAGALTHDAHAAFVGDVNCDGDVNPGDAIAVLTDMAEDAPAGGCAAAADFDCDTDSDIADILRILRYSAGIDDAPVTGCPAIDSVTAGTTTQQLAADLAGRLTSGTDASRYRALLHVARVIGIGVYDSEGEAVLLGEEREAGDFYLYDFELNLLAEAEGNGEYSSLASVAAILTDMGITETGGGEVTALAMWTRLLNAVQHAVDHPDDRGSFLAILVRELGLAQDPSYDLLGPVPLDDIRLSPAQEFLLVTDVAAYFVFQNGPVDVTESQLVENSSGILRSAPSGVVATCEEWGKDIKQIWGVGVLVVGLTAAGPAAVLTAVIIDGIHAMILAYSIEVRALPGNTFTHYGHENPGNPIDFKIFVNMRDDVGDIFIKCGWLLAVEFPPKGPIEGVDILWAGKGSLQRNGIVTCPANGCEKTGADGVATLHFQPDQEQAPYGTGIEHRYNDLLVGNALYLSRHNNILGKVNERLTPKEVEFNWGVEWHAPSCITNGSPFGGATTQGETPTIPPELAALPCSFSGTANGTMFRQCCGVSPFITEEGTNQSTITFANPTWNGFNQVEYEVTGGQFTWHSDGTLGSGPNACNFSQGGTEDVLGTLWISSENGQLTYDAFVSSTDQERRLECPPNDGQPIIENVHALSTCATDDVENITDGSTLSGSCHREAQGFTFIDDYTWDFEAGPCVPSPEPVCTASLP